MPHGDPPHPLGTPDDVNITWEARAPVTDPTLGIDVPPPAGPPGHHRLVTVGDSLTHGFQSGAVSRTSLSWPALVAKELGWADFRYPTYEGYGGLPLNIEVTLRHLEAEFGTLELVESIPAVAWLLHWAHQVEHWWAVGADDAWHPPPGRNHNLGVYSFDVADSWRRTLAEVERAIVPPSHEWLRLMVPNDVDRAARRVLVDADQDMGTIDVAKAHGDDGGIETLVVALGANNVLDVVIKLDYSWATGEADRGKKTVWSPTFFASDWAELVRRIKEIDAQHVILATVPHVTIVPLLSRAGDRLRSSSRYFAYYTHVWLADRFDRGRDRYLTGDQARAIDSAIDQYNQTIIESVRAARQEGRDWYVLEMSGMLDRLAFRRYLTDDAAEAVPTWWKAAGGAYPLPAALRNLTPPPDSRFFLSGPKGRTQGGLFALDGVHPTTAGYGLLAQEVIRIMAKAGVTFYKDDGVTPRTGRVAINFNKLLTQDPLLTDPPKTLASDVKIIGFINDKVNLLSSLLGRRGLV